MDDQPSTDPQSGLPDPAGSSVPPLPPAPIVDPAISWSAPVAPRDRSAHRRGRILGAIALVVLLVAGVAGAAAFFLLRGSGEELLGMVPVEADVVAVAYLDPSAGQKVNLLRMTDKFPDLGGSQDLQARVHDLLDGALQGSGMNHDDLDWVGVEVAVAVDVRRDQDPSVAVMVDSDDDDAARATLQKLASSNGAPTRTIEIDGVEITVSEGFGGGAFALVDGTVVMGTDPQAVENVIRTAKGDAPGIQENQAFIDATAALPDGRLGLAFVNVRHLSGEFGDALDTALASAGTSDFDAIEGFGFSLSAESDGMAMDLVTAYDETRLSAEERAAMSEPDHPNALLAMVPADAYGLLAFGHLDTTLKATLDQLAQQDPGTARELEKLGLTGADGLLAQLSGDIALEVGPAQGAPLGGTFIVGTNDPDATAAWITDTLGQLPLGGQRLVRRPTGRTTFVDTPPNWQTTVYHGVKITYLDAGSQPTLAWAIVGDAVVVGSSVADVQQVVDLSQNGGGIDQEPGFTTAAASVPSGDGVLFVDIQAALDGVRTQLDPSAQAGFDEQVKDLAPISTVVVGFSNGASAQHMRLLVQIP